MANSASSQFAVGVDGSLYRPCPTPRTAAVVVVVVVECLTAAELRQIRPREVEFERLTAGRNE